MSGKAHIIFDLDGTLINSKLEIARTYRTVFAKIPPVIEIDAENLNYGATITDVLKSVYGEDEEKSAQAKAMFSSIYDNSEYVETQFYDGVIETLSILKRQGHHLYIATNKRFTPTVRILQKKHIFQLFTDIEANEKEPGVTPTKKEMIRELKSQFSFKGGFFVGDTSEDIKAGKSEKMKTVAVTYGYETREQLQQMQPDYTVDSFKELLNFVSN